MAKLKYAYQNFDETCASAYGRDLPVSTKTSIEMCSFLKGRSIEDATKILERVLIFKQAIPFRRFNDGVGHRRGKIGPGRYPQKLTSIMLKLLKNVKANAETKGLSDSLKLVHMCAHKAATPFHQGRQRRRAMKRTHIELVVKDVSTKKEQSKPKVETIKPKVETTTPKGDNK
jgi:large subunit ribosomal protein L22